MSRDGLAHSALAWHAHAGLVAAVTTVLAMPGVSVSPAHAHAPIALPAAAGFEAKRLYLPYVARSQPLPLRPVPTVQPNPYPDSEGLAGCTVEADGEVWSGDLHYRVTERRRYNARGQLQQSEFWNERYRMRIHLTGHFDRAGKPTMWVRRQLIEAPPNIEAPPTDMTHHFAQRYDASGRLVREDRYLRGRHVYAEMHDYDDRGNWVRVRRGLDSLGRPRFDSQVDHMEYDHEGRRTRSRTIEIMPDDLLSETVYEWDGPLLRSETYRGLQESLPRPWERRTRHTYDEEGRLTMSVLEAKYGESSSRLVSDFSYDESGRLLQRRQTNGEGDLVELLEYDYDGAGRVLEQRQYGPSRKPTYVSRRTFDCPEG